MKSRELVEELSLRAVDANNSDDTTLVVHILTSMRAHPNLRQFIVKVVESGVVTFNSPIGVTLIFEGNNPTNSQSRIDAIEHFLNVRYSTQKDVEQLHSVLIDVFANSPNQEEMEIIQRILCLFFKVSFDIPKGIA